ncbi:MAG: ACP S-malonyltransferase [Pirellulales bacterium]|nr:ACP S-malonyltransferase [Pirellulales bacterium]
MSKVAFLFPGQGAQAVGMAAQLHESHEEVQTLFSQANEILGYDLASLCFDGPADDLNSTVHSQPALFVASLAALMSLKKESPDVMESVAAAAGLSLGEYTAYVFAGSMSFEDGLRLVQKRGEAMQAAADVTPSGMVSVIGPSINEVHALCDQVRGEDIMQIANFLCPGNTVCSGHAAACERLLAAAEESGARAVKLTVAGAFHTPIMQPADERLAEALQGVGIQSPRLPVISNVDGQSHASSSEIKDLLVKQLIQPVRWEDSIRAMIADGFTHFYEIGPGRVLRGLMRRIDRGVNCDNIAC